MKMFKSCKANLGIFNAIFVLNNVVKPELISRRHVARSFACGRGVEENREVFQKQTRKMVWFFGFKGPSGFSARSTAEEVTRGIDGSGIVAIVTGASSGIGTETARVLALRGVRVFMAVRNMDAGRNAKETIVKDNPTAKVDVMELDLTSKSSIRKFVFEYESLNLPLHILINNAGVFATPFLLSQDGIEMQFATNHIGHFLLTELLLEKMKTTARECNIEGKIINVSSRSHILASKAGILFAKINDKSTYNSWVAYGQSKLANILHANELSRRLKEEGLLISANSLNPGLVATNILRYNGILNRISQVIRRFLMKTVQQGAATTCYVALNPQMRGVSGKYFSDSNEAKPSKLARDPKLAKKLWDFSMDLIK